MDTLPFHHYNTFSTLFSFLIGTQENACAPMSITSLTEVQKHFLYFSEHSSRSFISSATEFSHLGLHERCKMQDNLAYNITSVLGIISCDR